MTKTSLFSLIKCFHEKIGVCLNRPLFLKRAFKFLMKTSFLEKPYLPAYPRNHHSFIAKGR